MNNISFKIADTKELLLQSYQLVYKRYIDVGFCRKNLNQIYFSFHDLLQDTRTFVVEMDKKVFATLSVITDNSAGIPCDHLFGNEVRQFRSSFRNIAEISHFAVDSGKNKYSILIFPYLFKLLYHNFLNSNLTDLIIMVEPKHCNLYKKYGFEVFSGVKLDPNADNAESILMRLKLKEKGLPVPYLCYEISLKEEKEFQLALKDSLTIHQDLNNRYGNLFFKKNSFTDKEFRFFNFRSYQMYSYLHRIKLELQNTISYDQGYHYGKELNELLKNWPQNHLNQLRLQAEKLLDSCYCAINEKKLSYVS